MDIEFLDKRMDWNDIKWFYQVSRYGSFSAAARVSGTTQATISRRIQKLEQQLGAALFQRGNEDSQLTPLGKELARSAASMAVESERFEKQFRQLAAGTTHIVLTCGSLTGLFLSKNISQLHQGLNNLDIDLLTTNRLLNLDKGEADLALRNKRPDKGLLSAQRISTHQYGRFSVFGSDKFFANSCIGNAAELARFDWISYSRSQAHVPSALWIEQHIPQDRIKYQMNSALMILQVVADNEALALLPQFIGRDTEGLVELFGPVEGIQFELWAVRRETSQNDPVISKLIANIENLFMNWAPNDQTIQKITLD